MGKSKGLALGHIGGDVPLIDLGLDLVVDEHHHNVAPLGGLGDRLHLKTGLLGLGPVFGALPQAHAHVAAGVLQVQGMGMALRAVADDGDLLTVQIGNVAVFLVVHFSHGQTLLHFSGIFLRIADYRGKECKLCYNPLLQGGLAQIELGVLLALVADGVGPPLQGHHAGAD